MNSCFTIEPGPLLWPVALVAATAGLLAGALINWLMVRGLIKALARGMPEEVEVVLPYPLVPIKE